MKLGGPISVLLLLVIPALAQVPTDVPRLDAARPGQKAATQPAPVAGRGGRLVAAAAPHGSTPRDLFPHTINITEATFMALLEVAAAAAQAVSKSPALEMRKSNWYAASRSGCRCRDVWL